MLAFSIGYAYLCSAAYVLTLQFFLPQTDAVKNLGFLVLFDPFVQAPMILTALIIGFIGSFFAWNFLHSSRLAIAGTFCFLATLIVFFIFKASLLPSVILGSIASIFVAYGISLVQPKAA